MTITVAELLKDKARQAPDSTLFTVAPGLAVAEAVRMMSRHKISSVIVAEGEKMVGLISLRELLHGLDVQGGPVINAPCSSIMKANPPVAKLTDTVDQLRGMMTELYITHVPVMDADKLVGILSFHDIARSAIKDVDFENKLLKQYIRNWPE
jgi:CBS domain-containing protein